MTKLPFEEKEREIVVKRESQTNQNLGCNPDDRKTEEIINFGVINLDKPKGPSSHQISDYVQKILGINKAGHSGTLDPAVTGVLPIALGRSTRVVEALLKAGKEYVCVMHLHDAVPEEKLRKVVGSFVGKITQLPPIRSAVKRVERQREIYYIEILEIEDNDVLFIVGCEAGTYIRKLCHDLGQKLKVGAHMAELRRTKAGPFSEDDNLITLQNLIDGMHYWKEDGNDKFIRHCIQPIEKAVEHLPKIWVFDTTITSLSHGVSLKVPGIAKLNSDIVPEQMIAIMSLKDELIGLATSKMSAKDIMSEERGIAAEINKVFIKEDMYLIASKEYKEKQKE